MFDQQVFFHITIKVKFLLNGSLNSSLTHFFLVCLMKFDCLLYTFNSMYSFSFENVFKCEHYLKLKYICLKLVFFV